MIRRPRSPLPVGYWLIEYSDTSLEKDLNFKTAIYAELDIPEY